MLSHLDDATLNSYLDDALDPAARARADAHLAACPACRDSLQSLRTLAAAFDAWHAEPIPRDVTPQVMARIAQHPIPRAYGSLSAWLVAAQLVIVAALVLWVLPNVMSALTGIPIPAPPLPALPPLVLPQPAFAAPALALNLPALASWMWLALLAGAVTLWLVAHRLILNTLPHSSETSR